MAELGLPEVKLLKVIAKVKANPDIIDLVVGRKSVHEASDHLFIQVADVVSLPMKVGDQLHDWDCCRVGPLFDLLSSSCPEFGKLLCSLDRHLPSSPTRPWAIIVYYDETVPGDPLRLDHLRKFMGVYISLANFGPTLLKHERCWLPAAILRTSIIKRVRGGWSCCLKEWLRRLLLDSGNVRDGVPLRVLGGRLAFFKLGHLLADEGGHTYAMAAKGSTAVFPSLEIHNMCSNDPAKSVVRPGETLFVDLSCIFLDRFVWRTNEDIWKNIDTLLALKAAGAPTLAQKEISYGLNAEPDGVLAHVPLRPYVRPRDVLVHDPTHTIYSNGLIKTELELLLPCLKTEGISFNQIYKYLESDWVQPRCFRRGNRPSAVFSDKRAAHYERLGTIQGWASELMGVVRPLAHFLQTSSVRTRLPLEVDSWVKLACFCQKLQDAKFGKLTETQLANAAFSHGEAFLRAYDGEGVKPKFLNARLLSLQLARDGFLFDTFPCERKHSLLKLAALPIKNTSNFERTVIARALNLHKASLEHEMADGLVTPQPDPEMAAELGVISFAMAADMRLDGTLYGQGDVVLTAAGAMVIATPCSLQYDCDSQAISAWLVRDLVFVEQALLLAPGLGLWFDPKPETERQHK